MRMVSRGEDELFSSRFYGRIRCYLSPALDVQFDLVEGQKAIWGQYEARVFIILSCL